VIPPAIIGVFAGRGAGESGFLQKAGSPAFFPKAGAFFLFRNFPIKQRLMRGEVSIGNLLADLGYIDFARRAGRQQGITPLQAAAQRADSYQQGQNNCRNKEQIKRPFPDLTPMPEIHPYSLRFVPSSL
jgi:hypothetical protein